MATKNISDRETGLANASLNSSRRSGTDESGKGNTAHPGGQRDSTASAKVPDQQIPNARRQTLKPSD
jgi:hypothetical protein